MAFDKQWSPLEALNVVAMELPGAKDQTLLKALGIGQGVINRIQDAIDAAGVSGSRADDDVFAALIEARGALDKAWGSHTALPSAQEIPKELFDAIDATIHRGHLSYVADVAANSPSANVGDLYENDPRYAGALVHLIPDFEYPDWGWKTAGVVGREVVAREAKKIAQLLEADGKTLNVDDKVYFGRGTMEFVGLVVAAEEGRVTVSGAEIGCLSARRATVTIDAPENLRVMNDTEWAERTLNEPAFAEFITQERYRALQAELEGLELSIAKGEETEATDFRIHEIDLLMENSPWMLDPDSVNGPLLSRTSIRDANKIALLPDGITTVKGDEMSKEPKESLFYISTANNSRDGFVGSERKCAEWSLNYDGGDFRVSPKLDLDTQIQIDDGQGPVWSVEFKKSANWPWKTSSLEVVGQDEDEARNAVLDDHLKFLRSNGETHDLRRAEDALLDLLPGEHIRQFYDLTGQPPTRDHDEVTDWFLNNARNELSGEHLKAMVDFIAAERLSPIGPNQVAQFKDQIELATQCKDILAEAKDMGLARVDAGRLTALLETGDGPERGMFVGKIVGVDGDKGLVFQATGRGDGVVLPLDKLSRPVQVGEMATITFKDGRGTVEERMQSQDRGR